jgi:hypothetical protein
MSTIRNLFTNPTTASIDKKIGELAAVRSERLAEADAAEQKVAGEIIETGTSRSAKTHISAIRKP